MPTIKQITESFTALVAKMRADGVMTPELEEQATRVRLALRQADGQRRTNERPAALKELEKFEAMRRTD